MRFVIAAALSAAVWSMIFDSALLHAHEGHNHAEQAAPVSPPGAARSEGASGTFEVVAIAHGDELSIYLDRCATNEPVDGATIEVETPAGPVTAAGKADEPYLPADVKGAVQLTTPAGKTAQGQFK
jgi:membrane fusion protein, heavy metal efflux system